MSRSILPRTLWYENEGKIVEVEQSFLTASTRSLVVLGEAGMGKSTLLEQLRTDATCAVCNARQLINRNNPPSLLGTASTLVVDAVDEVATQREGDAVDLVVRQLGALGYPRFILSCRVADWRSATALQGLADQYDVRPLELHLNPLDRDNALAFLSQTLGDELSEAALAHLEQRGLDGLWKNPQTLELVERVAEANQLPNSKGDLFERAVPLLRTEYREEKGTTLLASLPEREILDAAGAAFAALILSGKEAVSRKVSVSTEDLSLSEVATLPGAGRLMDVLGARLFEARGSERFTYAHRAIGEFVGARWLAAQADTPRKQRRLLSLLHSKSLVPASLRGIHAWLAWHSPALANGVIAADPMGVIEYGDADRLDVSQGDAMLKALGALAEENPHFRTWGPYRVGGIVQKALLPEVRSLLTAPGTEFGLRLLILQALKDSPLAKDLADTLRALLLDKDAIFANRSEAGDRLASLSETQDWPLIVETLLTHGDENGVRLASEMVDEVGYDGFSDALLLKVILAQIQRTDRMAGVFYSLERRLPDSRLRGVLDLLAPAVAALGRPHERPGDSALTDLAYGLIARQLNLGGVNADRLWAWLEPFDSQTGYHRETRGSVAEILSRDVDLRRAVQRKVLLESTDDKSVWQRSWRLSKRSTGLSPTEEDVLALLNNLDPSERQDERWRDLLQMVSHQDGGGVDVREAARAFAQHRPDMLAWIDSLCEPRVYDWQIKQEAERRKRSAKRATLWAEHRADYAKHIEELRRGEYGYVVNPAKAYLKLFQDMGDEGTDGPGRITEWLSSEICEAALEGFEAFLKIDPPVPDAQTISESHAEGRAWSAANIIVAALGERWRTKVGFTDLPAERLMAGLFEIFRTRVDDHAGLHGLEAGIEVELRQRGVWEAVQRLYFEPQLKHRTTFVDRLHSLMRGEADMKLAADLAHEWLIQFPDIPNDPETQLVDRLLRSGRFNELRAIAQGRLGRTLDDERRRNWQAVDLIVDFEAARVALESLGDIDPLLLWSLRARLGDRRRNEQADQLEPEAPLLAWMVARFRPLFPVQERPHTVTTGDSNPWDAADYLNALIRRLGSHITDTAIADLVRLRDAPADGYSNYLRVVATEQRRNRIEAEFHPFTLADVNAVVSDDAPSDATQLQAIVIEELGIIREQLRGSDVNWYSDFLAAAGKPKIEDDCRDAILKMVRPLPFDIQALPEGHIADDKRCDIICLLGNLMVPIEVKGQWHPALWTAADHQLDHLYVNDWRAERGIFLVLWFGPGTSKPLKNPPAGVPVPTTAAELRATLESCSVAAQSGRVEIFVLDLTRPVL